MSKIILYPDILFNDNFAIEKPLVGNSYSLHGVDAKSLHDIDKNILQEAVALVTGLKLKIDKSLISELDNCKIITRLGVGYDIIDVKECLRRGIPVCNVPDYGTCEVSDHALALLLNFARGISFYNENLKDDITNNWDYSSAVSITRLQGKRLGILGLGRIGTASA